MKVLIIAKNDWANVGYNIDMALRSVGVDSVCLKKGKHGLGYSKQAKVYNEKELKQYALEANILQFMHSVHVNIGIKNQYEVNKGIAVFHGGSKYRGSTNKINDFWNNKIGLALVQTGDLLDKGAKNEVWFLPPIDTEGLQPVYNRSINNKRLISHCPSREDKKGTREFSKIMNRLKVDPEVKNKFVYKLGKRTSWPLNIKRMMESDIYFDACCPKLDGKVYGEWGISALEACCLGKVVVSHFLSVDRYRKEFDKECLIQHANNMKQVEQQMRRLILMSDEEFSNLQRKTREWVVENHSYKVVGERLVNIYNEYLTWEGKSKD